MSYLLADGDYYDAGAIVGGAYGEGGPPLTYTKYKAYYKRHFGNKSDKIIKAAYDKRLLGDWIAVGRRAGKQKHKPARNKKYAPKKAKKKTKKVSSLAAKKKAYFKRWKDRNNDSRIGALAAWRKLHPEDKPKRRAKK